VLKKKVTEYEQKSEMLKRKSDCYEHLMTKQLKLDEIPSDGASESNTDVGNGGGDSRTSSPTASQDQWRQDSSSPSLGAFSPSVVTPSQESSAVPASQDDSDTSSLQNIDDITT